MLGCPFGWRTNPAAILPCLKDAPSPHLWGNFRESLRTHTHVLQPRPPGLALSLAPSLEPRHMRAFLWQQVSPESRGRGREGGTQQLPKQHRRKGREGERGWRDRTIISTSTEPASTRRMRLLLGK